MSTEKRGCILIADITGYTRYLSGSELEHAKDTLTELLELLVDHARPPLVVSRLEGDAVISYGLQTNFVTGQTFVELIEDTYVAFRRAIELMVLNNTCRCNACANVSGLDLKCFVHSGAFVLQKMLSYEELVGTDVNLVHRLVKNHVTEATGFRAYTLYTAAAVEELGLVPEEIGWAHHRESYEDVGDVDVWVQDMHPVWEAKRDIARIEVRPEDVVLEVETEIDLPRELVWDYLVQPEFRRVLIDSDRQEVVDRKDGRVADGSVYLCYHGKKVVRQAVVEWLPFQRMVTRDRMPIPIEGYVLGEYLLEPTAAGTRLVQRVAKPTGRLLARLMTKVAVPRMKDKFQRDIEAFRDHIEGHASDRDGRLAGAAEISMASIEEAARRSLNEA